MLEKYAKLLRQVAEERANEGNRDKNDRILILDGLNNYIRCFAAVPVLTDDGIHIGGITGFLLSMGSMIRQFKPTRCVVVFDGKNGSTRRKKLYSEYKEGRTFKLNPKRIENLGHSEEKELESMREQFKALMTYLQNMPLTVMSIDNVEADDVIAYIAQNVAEKEVVISSMDKDFIHIVNDRISVWSPSAKQLITPEWIREKHNLSNHNFLVKRIFEGDASDNISGVKGVGLKTLIKRIPIVTQDEPISLQEIYDYCEQQISDGSKIKLYKTILDSKDVVERNRKLMNLKEVDMSGSIKSSVRNQMETPIPPLNVANIKIKYMEDKLYSGMANIDSWLKNTFTHLNTFSNK